MSPITYASEGGAASDAAALAVLLDAAGVPARPARPGEPALIAHGTAAAAPAGLHIPLATDRPAWEGLATLDPATALSGDSLGADVVTAARLLLDDTWADAIEPDALDRHGRLRAESGPAIARLAGSVPLVNRLATLLGDACRRRFGIEPLPRWPDGRRAAVGLSHDVDRPERYAVLGDLWRPWRLRRAPRTQLRAALELARERLADRSSDDHWAFDELMALEDRYGVRSTFLFSVTPHHERLGSTLDPAYDASGARYRRLFHRLDADGWEIGLHASYRAYEAPERLAAERDRLAELAKAEIRGLRHHYWQLGPDPAATLRGHEAAGFTYDSSIAFNDAPGFRRGIALPFHPFDASLGRPLGVLELPTTLMDGNLHYRETTTDAAVASAVAHLETVRGAGGLAVVDWHSHTSVASNRRFRAWGETYERILAWLDGQPDLWVAPLAEIAEWHAARAARLRSLAEGSDGSG